MILDRLKELCGGDDGREHLRKPFPIRFGGRSWIAATNGHVLAAVQLEADIPPSSLIDQQLHLKRDFLDSVVGFVEKPATQNRISLDAVRQWAGELPAKKKCPECHGSGTHYCECGNANELGHECGYCYGDFLPREKRPSRFGKKIFLDQNLLSLVFSILPGAEATIAFGEEKDHPVRFDGDGWRVAIMPMRYEDDFDAPAKLDIEEISR